MTTILELNDADLTLYRDGRPVYRAPGVAVVNGRDVSFGEPALRLSRVYPRQANLQYLGRMSPDPLAYPTPRARNHADLVYLHLQEVAAQIDEAIVLAVPGVYSAEQLGVLLGILQEAHVTVGGFVDSAVAAASTLPLPAAVWHVDILMHRAVLTALRAEDTVSRVTADELTDCGLARLLDTWIRAVADRFIRDTRFDPLHAAAAEQQLFDQIFDTAWTGAGGRELAFELVQGDVTRRVELGRQLLEEKAAPRYRTITARLPAGAHVLLTARSAALPGLLEALEDEARTVTILNHDALPRGCAANLDAIVTGPLGLRLITRLPRRLAPESSQANASGAAEGSPTAGTAGLPTHVLAGNRAIPLGHRDLGFGVVRHGAVSLLRPVDGLTLNGSAIFRDTALELGDRIEYRGHDYLVISVEV
jgi:hypothetical protein